MKRIVALLALLIVLIAPLSATASPGRFHGPVHTLSSLSGQCHYNYDNPWSNGDGYVRADVDLYCTVSHTRESQVCVVFSTNYGYSGNVWTCDVNHGGMQYGTDFFAETARWSASSSIWTVNVWFWMYDNSNGETWTGWGCCWTNLWRKPA
jgi:hypothetical protein